MFTKNVISQDMIDAVNSILVQEEKKQMLLEPGKKMELETGFHMAAHAAKKANQSHFEFQGKKYPVTAKSTAEAVEELDELSKKTLGSYVKSAAKDAEEAGRDQEYHGHKNDYKRGENRQKGISKAVDRLTKEEKDDDSMYTTKAQAKKIADKEAAKEVHKHEKHLHKGAKETKFDEAKTESEKEFMDRQHRLSSDAAEKWRKENPEKVAKLKRIPGYTAAMDLAKKTTTKEEVDLDEERHMTGAEKEKREKIVKSMKKGMAGFKERYGNRAKNVMYATATKQAMKEEVQELDEAKSEYDLYHPHYTSAIHHALAHHAAKGLTVHDDDYFNHVSVGPRKPIEGQTVIHHVPATDDKGNQHFIHMQIYNRGADKKPFELNTYSSKVPKRNVKEEIENLQELGGMSTSGASGDISEDPVVDTLSGPKSINALPKKRAKEIGISNGHESAKFGKLKAEAKTPGDNSVPFVTNENSPLNLAKKMAHKSFKKIKNEMLGKDGETSE
jgi:hypothetical protein